MDILLPEFKQMLALLNKYEVSYMLIGGYAVIYHGYERNTTDMDVWLEPSAKNRNRLIPALREFGIGEESLNKLAEADFTQVQYFYFNDKPRRIDFLTRISGVTYDTAEKEAVHFFMGDERIPIINYHHLILSKIANKRTKDKADVEELQHIHQHLLEPDSIFSKLKKFFAKK